MFKLAVTDKPTQGMRAGILNAIDAYNDLKMGKPGGHRLLVIPVREGKSRSVTGGLWGYTWAQWLFVELLVVPEAMRGRGLGTRLMQAAETEAIARGCVGIWLDTHSFQARPFYEKLGFTTFGVIENFPPGHSRYYLSKKFPTAR